MTSFMAEFRAYTPEERRHHLRLLELGSAAAVAECCLCFMPVPIAEWWTLVPADENLTGYLACADCAETFKDEPERAYLEILDWMTMLDEVKKDA